MVSRCGSAVLAKVRNVVLDVGARQHDALSVDRKGSLEAYARHSVLPRNAQIATEVGWLRGAGPGGRAVDLVVSDIVPLACAAAAEAGVPCAACSNFSWDFIYSDYLSTSSRPPNPPRSHCCPAVHCRARVLGLTCQWRLFPCPALDLNPRQQRKRVQT